MAFRPPPRLLCFVLICIAGLVLVESRELLGKASPRLSALLTLDPRAPSHQRRVDNSDQDNYFKHITVWVIFTDKGDTDNVASLPVTPRALQRRAKHLSPHRAQMFDIPVNEDYQRQVVETAGALGFVRLRQVSTWTNAVSLQLATLAQLEAIAQLPFVKELDLVRAYFRPNDEHSTTSSSYHSKRDSGLYTLSYGESTRQLEVAGVPALHELGYAGQGVVVAVLDSGFQLTHPAFANLTILATHDFVSNDDNVDWQTGDRADITRHGTATLSNVAAALPGEIYGPAFNADMLLARTEDVATEVKAEEDHFVAALEWAERKGADVISSSLGYDDWYEWQDFDGKTAVTTRGVNAAVALGLVVVTSNGNSGTKDKTIGAPADAFNIISVGATDGFKVIADFSSYGPTADGRLKPEVTAQGKNAVVAKNDNLSIDFMSGTSFAAPTVAGIAAILLQAHPNWTNAQVREALIKTAERFDSPDVQFGYGPVNATKAFYFQQQTDCQANCKDGSCQDGKCVCNPGAYNLWCDGHTIACFQYCGGTCSVDGECLCRLGQVDRRCLPNERLPVWNCSVSEYNRGDGVCQCHCNRYDPDCDNSPREVVGCAEGEGCYHYHFYPLCARSSRVSAATPSFHLSFFDLAVVIGIVFSRLVT